MGSRKEYYCDRCGKDIEQFVNPLTSFLTIYKSKIIDFDPYDSPPGVKRLLLCGDCTKSFKSWVKAPKEE